MIDKSKRKATMRSAGTVFTIHMTGGPDCLWLNMYLDAEERQMTCDSDIGSYAYHWGKSANNSEDFIEFCCRWLANEEWLLRKCIDERHGEKAFNMEKTATALRDMVLEYNEDEDNFYLDELNDAFDVAAEYYENARAWALAFETATDYRKIGLPEEWYEAIEEEYTPWQKRFAEICREVIVPLLEQHAEGVRRLLREG